MPEEGVCGYNNKNDGGAESLMHGSVFVIRARHFHYLTTFR